MRRLIAIALVLVLVLGVSVTGYAAPPWKSGGLPPGIQKQITLAFLSKLKDLDEVPWAKHAAEKMFIKDIIKGYDDHTFRPKKAVTKMEAVALIVRVMGWEDEALEDRELPRKYKGKKVADWAWGYVKIAYEKGILDEVDMMYFNPEEPAKRWEVAKFIVRALGYEDEAQDHMDDRLPFKDFGAIPVGAVGYVYVINDLGLMVGEPDGTFNPNKPVTRAEMAVLVERLDDKVDSDVDEREIKGEVVDIDEDDYILELEVDGDVEEYEAVEGIAVYHDGRYMDFDRLEEGNTVKILLNEEGKVIFIELLDEEEKEEDKIIEHFSGTVKAVDPDDRELTIKSGTAIFIFEVRSNADIEIDGEDADLDDIEVGDYVKVRVDDRNRIVDIRVEREGEEEDEEVAEVEGTVYAITTGKVMGITVRLDNGQLETYKVDDDTEITLEGEEAELGDLESGMEVELKVQGSLALEIAAEPEEEIREVEGTIYRIGDDWIRVKAGSTYKTFDIDGDTDIEVDGRDCDIDDLKVNMEVKVRYRAELALRIRAYSVESEAEGVITDIDDGDEEITVETDDGEKVYSLEDADIYVDDEDADFDDLKIGMEVELKIINDTTVEEVHAELDRVEGEVVSVDPNNMRITLKLYGEVETYELDDDVEVEIDDEDADLEDIEAGTDVILEFEDGRVVEIKG